MHSQRAVVIGAGIAGLAMARALSIQGFQVTVIERSEKAAGASVRNFGMVWPIGQPSGELYEVALRSRSIWKEFGESCGFFFDDPGSLHLAYNMDETRVLEELYEIYGRERKLSLISPGLIAEKSDAVLQQGLIKGLYSPTELIVDPREAIREIPHYLSSIYGVEFRWGQMVLAIDSQTVYTAYEETKADIIVVCSGADIDVLFPDIFSDYPVTRCKLQMMRMGTQPGNWRIGPALCGGLSLIHYGSFKVSPSLAVLKKRYAEEMEEYLDLGIHVMVSQNGQGELTVGDSHEYGQSFDPFDKEKINRMILDYLSGFAKFRNEKVTETWHGIYSKLTNGDAYLFANPMKGVYVFNGLGGAGMTLSFGLSEQLIQEI
jgi:FAD dependent oxidoreductase TIGR03364